MNADRQRCSFGVDSPYVELAVEVFSLLADPTRVRIVLALREDELSVNHLADILDKPPAAVSQHLAKLRWGRIVKSRQEGTRVFYSLVDEHARTLVTQAVFQAQHALGDDPEHHRGSSGSPRSSGSSGSSA
ncbi:helix-turn-helix transcriptional regulator [Miniimonas arenae]|uniref:Helix-turn-helix transcriptional regulator n=1 Tax=Miniimonas arenae TaxID=676201 RepID=A0A5C5B9E3_9MICO|nr:metalloregulator ArsR/SmtB family transcription factor [Miniimonas arenae]TNU73124.1 helix-turn-helix transcriptional regulator [Miniimonas arenae]